MKRQDQIKEMAQSNAKHMTCDKDMQVAFADALRRGAEWADEHPDIDVRTMSAWRSGYQAAIDKACEWLEEKGDDMTRQEQLNEAWCKYMGKCSIEIIQALAFALRWADQHPHWISVEDELPNDGAYVVTINKVGLKEVRHFYHDKWFSSFGNEYGDVTHWMPLPKLSKSENIGKKGGEQIIGTADHIKIALGVIDKKGSEKNEDTH